MSKLSLYSFYQSSAAYRVRIALNYKGLDYDYKAVDLTKAQQHEASFAEINPMKEIPTIEYQGQSVSQSMAILLWLDQVFPQNRLFPQNPFAMAQVVQFCENINSGIHPVQNLKVRQELEKRFGATAEAREEWCGYWIHRGFESLEKFLKKSSGEFCFGNEVSAADMFLVPQTFNARRYRIDMTAFPTIVRIDKTACELDAFKKAHPNNQPDTPKTTVG